MGWFFGIAASQIDVGLEKTFYAVEMAVAAVLFTNMMQFAFWRCSARKGAKLTHWEKWDGAYWIALATVFSLPFPTAVVFIYVGEIKPYPWNKMWHSGSWAPNTPHGIILYVMKWLGTVFLTIGVMKTTLLHRKILKKWRQVRPSQQEKKTSPAPAASESSPPQAQTASDHEIAQVSF